MPMTESLSWKVYLPSAKVHFGRMTPFAGNTYRLCIDDGEGLTKYVAYVMAEDGTTCLAKSHFDGTEYTIAFDSKALWEEFRRDPHELRVFHCYIRQGAWTGSAIAETGTAAEGDLAVTWNPLWTERETGEAFTMKGEKGDKGDRGERGSDGADGEGAYGVAVRNGFEGTEEDWLASLRGPAGMATAVYSEEEAKWFPLGAKRNEQGDVVVSVGQTGEPMDANAHPYVSRTESQTVSGAKTFTGRVEVPDAPPPGTEGASGADAVNTRWADSHFDHRVAGIESGAHVWTGSNKYASAPMVAAAEDAAEKTVRSVVAGDGDTPELTDTFQKTAAGEWKAKIGRLTRIVGGSQKDCFMQTSVDGAGVRSIDFTNADKVTAPTMSAGDSSTAVATTGFVAAALAATGVAGALVGVQELSGFTTAVKTYTVSAGMAAGKTYRIVLLWHYDSTSGGITVNDTLLSATTGGCKGLHAKSWSGCAGPGKSFSIKTGNTSYCATAVALVFAE